MLMRAAALTLPLVLAACATNPPSRSGRGPAFDKAAEYAHAVGVRPSLAQHVLRRESGGSYSAKNPRSSASGPMQVIDGMAAAIAGRPVSRRERMSNVGLKLGIAYLKLCQDALPKASDHSIWVRCYVAGHGNVSDGDITPATTAFKTLEKHP